MSPPSPSVSSRSSSPPRSGRRRKPVHVEPDVFAGLGTWIDIYDGGAPEAARAPRRPARGTRASAPSTSRRRTTRPPTDVVNARQVGRLLDRLHVRGLQGGRLVPARLPPARQGPPARRCAMLSFRTPARQRLRRRRARHRGARAEERRPAHGAARSTCSASCAPPPAPCRSRRSPTRRACSSGTSAGGPRSRGRSVAAQVDAFIPMAYTGSSFPGYDATYGYVARSLRLLRAAVGPDVRDPRRRRRRRPMTAGGAEGVRRRGRRQRHRDRLEPLRPRDDDGGRLEGAGAAGRAAAAAPVTRPRGAFSACGGEGLAHAIARDERGAPASPSPRRAPA